MSRARRHRPPLRRPRFDGRRRAGARGGLPAASRSPSTTTSATGSSSRPPRRIAATLGAERHIVLPLDLSRFGGSALTDDIAVPKGGVEDGAIPVTYVPARNTIFLSLCLGWAEAAGARDIFIGVNALDYSGYPDCRPDFIAQLRGDGQPRHQGGRRGRALHRPHAAHRHDQGRHRRARRRGSGSTPAMSWSCYDPTPDRRALRPVRFLPAARQGLRRGGPARSDRATRATAHELRGQGDLPDPAGRGDAGGPPRRLPALRRLQSVERARAGPGRRRNAISATPISSAWTARMAAATRPRRWPTRSRRSGAKASGRLVVITGGEPMLQLDARADRRAPRARLRDRGRDQRHAARARRASTGSASAPRPAPRWSSARATS